MVTGTRGFTVTWFVTMFENLTKMVCLIWKFSRGGWRTVFLPGNTKWSTNCYCLCSSIKMHILKSSRFWFYNITHWRHPGKGMQKSKQNRNVEAKNRELNQTVIIVINGEFDQSLHHYWWCGLSFMRVGTYYWQGCHEGPGTGDFPQLLWMWPLPTFVGQNKKNRTKQNPQLLHSLSTCIISPVTWNFNDSPVWACSNWCYAVAVSLPRVGASNKFLKKLQNMVITLIPGCAILNAESWSSGQTCSKMSLAGRARAEPCRDVDGIASSRILPRSVVSCKSKTTHQVPVVQMSDSAIHRIKHYSQIAKLISVILIR